MKTLNFHFIEEGHAPNTIAKGRDPPLSESLLCAAFYGITPSYYSLIHCLLRNTETKKFDQNYLPKDQVSIVPWGRYPHE
jgi:hypothetical protein